MKRRAESGGEDSILSDSFPTEIVKEILENFADHPTLQYLAVIPRHARIPRGSLIRTIVEIYRDAQAVILAWNPSAQIAIDYLKSVNRYSERVETLEREQLLIRVLNVAYARAQDHNGQR